MKVSVVIVNYNAGALLPNCVRSLFHHAPDFDFEVIVVDNCSHDDSMAQVRDEFRDRVKLIPLDVNQGFAAANNIGVDASDGDILFFLNPDTELLSADIWRSFSGLDDQHIYTSRLVDKEGVEYGNISAVPTIANYCRKIFRRPYLAWAQGSVVIMHRRTFIQIGGWAEDYFMYSEDLDLFYKAAQCGISVASLDAAVMHIGGGTTATVWSLKNRQERVERAYYRFSEKYHLLFDYHVLHLMGFIRTCLKRPSDAWLVFSVYLHVVRSSDK